jgi:predicted acylesterase/phospholipase RssA
MLAVSAGGNHCAYACGILHQLFIDRPEFSQWRRLAGISAGSLLCAGLCETNSDRNDLYIRRLTEMYETMTHVNIVKAHSSLGTYLNTVFSFCFRDSLYQDTLPRFVRDNVNFDNLEGSDRKLSVGVYNTTQGRYETFQDMPSTDMFKPIVASASIPIVFPAVPIGTSMYVDGAVQHIIPVDEIMAWCTSNKGAVDIVCCYPFSTLEEFNKSEGISDCMNRSKSMKNVLQKTCIEMMWNNYTSDLKRLEEYFGITGIRDRPVNTWRTASRVVRIYSPQIGIFVDINSPNQFHMKQMFLHGKAVVQNAVKKNRLPRK